MDFDAIFAELGGLENAGKLVLSDVRKGSAAPSKLTARPVQLRGERRWQVEALRGTQAFHENLTAAETLARLRELLPEYKQLCAVLRGETVNWSFYGRRVKCTRTGNRVAETAAAHNREKSYLLPEGEPVPALVDLGVFTADYRIVRARYDKYRQINRFLELIDDALRERKEKKIRIMDFGCGKSYLTFILYYYLTVKRGWEAEVIGYDLKADVVEHCSAVAAKYGYTGLRFLRGDVSRDTEDAPDVDMLITLHACDTATDYALDYAIRNRVPYIFSVPCCQHEVNLSLHRGGGDLDIFTTYGLLQERMSALLTDAIRAELLKGCGYEVDVLEFVDLSHTPKNLMLRCRLKRPRLPELTALQTLRERYGFSQTLLRLTEERAQSHRISLSGKMQEQSEGKAT